MPKLKPTGGGAGGGFKQASISKFFMKKPSKPGPAETSAAATPASKPTASGERGTEGVVATPPGTTGRDTATATLATSASRKADDDAPAPAAKKPRKPQITNTFLPLSVPLPTMPPTPSIHSGLSDVHWEIVRAQDPACRVSPLHRMLTPVLCCARVPGRGSAIAGTLQGSSPTPKVEFSSAPISHAAPPPGCFSHARSLRHRVAISWHDTGSLLERLFYSTSIYNMLAVEYSVG